MIQAWLPPAAVKKIKFLKKNNISEYIDDENRREVIIIYNIKFVSKTRVISNLLVFKVVVSSVSLSCVITKEIN